MLQDVADMMDIGVDRDECNELHEIADLHKEFCQMFTNTGLQYAMLSWDKVSSAMEKASKEYMSSQNPG